MSDVLVANVMFPSADDCKSSPVTASFLFLLPVPHQLLHRKWSGRTLAQFPSFNNHHALPGWREIFIFLLEVTSRTSSLTFDHGNAENQRTMIELRMEWFRPIRSSCVSRCYQPPCRFICPPRDVSLLSLGWFLSISLSMFLSILLSTTMEK